MTKTGLRNNIVTRQSCMNDASDIAKIHYQCWQTNYIDIIDHTFLNSLKLEDRIKNREKIIREDPCIQLVTLYENKVVGFCDAGSFYFRENQTVAIHDSAKFKEPGEIYAIYIDPKYQNNGIGQILFSEARRQLFQKGLAPFIVWTLKDNSIAYKFYEKLNGKIIGDMNVNFGGREYGQIAFKFD